MDLTNKIKIINADDYEFWKESNKKFPESDDSNFRSIYQQIAIELILVHMLM